MAGRTVVVIDVLRWSTVVVTALAHGAAWVEAFASPEAAATRAAELRASVDATGERPHNLEEYWSWISPKSPACWTANGKRT